MKIVALKERRKYPRISDAIALRLNSDPSEMLDPSPTHVVKLSCGGLRFAHNTSIDAETNIKLCMHLPSSDQTIHLAGRVITSGEEKSASFTGTNTKRYSVQVEFVDVDQQSHQLLADHVDYVLGKTGLSHRLAVPA